MYAHRRRLSGGGGKLEQRDGIKLETAEVKDLARLLKVHRGRSQWNDGTAAGSAFLIGAGCSRSAGIMLAADIARKMVPELAQVLGAPVVDVATPDLALAWLKKERHLSGSCDFGGAYNEIFENYYKSGRKQREIIQEVIQGANEKMNWAHVCLGELVAQHYVHTVLTTNFDQLVARGIIFTGMLPMIADGVESMDRLQQVPIYPQVVHLHGTMHSYAQRNGTTAVAETSAMTPMQGTIWNVCRSADLLVVVGYAGREEGIVKLLASMANLLPQMVVFWITYEPDANNLSEDVIGILNRPNKYVIHGQDADAFFAELMGHLDEPVRWIVDPLKTLVERKVSLSEPAKWASELTRDTIQTGLDLFGQKLKAMEQSQSLPPNEAKVAEAAAASLSGKDETVIALLSDIAPDEDIRIAPLLAQSLIRSGDAKGNEAQLKLSVELLERHLASIPNDFSIEILLGDAHNAIADLLDTDSERQVEAAQHRELAKDAYSAAMVHVPAENLNTWRSVREKFATAVSEAGLQGGSQEALDLAIGALEELIDHPADFEMSRFELAEIFDRLAMLRLMRGQRSGSRSDLIEALVKSREAMDMVVEDLSTTTGIGILRNQASVYRALGAHAITSGDEETGSAELQQAADLYREAGIAYLDGVTDADAEQSRQAASDAFEEARIVFEQIGWLKDAAEMKELSERIHT